MNRSMRERLLATTMIAGAAFIASPGFAQTTAPAASQPAGSIEGQSTSSASTSDNTNGGGEIIVTGSRIPQPNLTSVSPITVVNSAQIKAQGVTRIEDLLNSLPQVFADQGGNISNGASGTAVANLRGLGPERTLVLIDGRRLVPGDPTSPFADLNFIPASLVKSVQVLTGGASSTYGADAVAGVVNFIMDRDYTGFKLDSQYSLYQHDNNSNAQGIRDDLAARNFGYPNGNTADGGTIDVTATVGAGFDDNRGHIVAYVGYRKLNAVTQDSRDYSACALQANTAATIATGGRRTVCGGSSINGNPNFILYDPAAATSTFYQLGAGRTIVPGRTLYNFAPTNYYQRPDERYTGGFFAHYDVSDMFKPYIEGMFMDDRSVAQIAPSGDFGNTLSVNCDNPLLSAQELGVICNAANLVTATGGFVGTSGDPAAVFTDPTTGATYNKGFLQVLKRDVEGGPRRDDRQHTSYRGVVGAKGDLAPGISYDAYYQYGRTLLQETYTNDFSINRLTKALDVVTGPDGTPMCRSAVAGTDTNCVPYDIFGQGGITPAAVAYLATPGFQRGVNTEQVASASVTALLGEYGIKSPWASEGVGLNVGAEYRKETLSLNTDEEFQTGDLAGQGAATLPVSGSFNVKELFAEARVPIVHDNFIYDASFDGGYRYSNYHVAGNSFSTNTFKLSGEIAPVKDIRFRVAYNRAVRAPNIQELFAPQLVALNGNSDPCAGADPTASQAACVLTGVSADQYGHIAGNSAGQYNGLIGGNTNLKPEKSNTITAGVIFEPSFLPGLAVTVDYFNIKIKNVITAIPQDTILSTCVNTGDPTFCGLIHRDQFGSLWRTPNGYVVDTDLNVGSQKTDGIDVNASYSHRVGELGTISASLIGTWLHSLKTNNEVSQEYNCSGFYGLQCGTPNPKWRHTARLNFNMANGLGVQLQWRYFSKVDIDLSSSNPSLNGTFSPVNAKIPSQSYFDLSFSAKMSDHYTFRLGVNNILDRDPPIVGSNGSSSEINACPSVFCNGNTFPNVYDALGRYIFAGVTLDF